MYANIRGMKGKKNSVIEILHDKDPHIFLLTETLLKSNTGMQIDGYKFFGRKREGKSGGGVGILVKNDIADKVIPHISERPIEMMWLSVRRNQIEPLFIAVYYGKQESRTNKEEIEQEMSLLQEEISEMSNEGDVIIAMDANAKIGLLNEEISRNGRLILQVFQEEDLNIVNGSEKCEGRITRQNTKNAQEISAIDFVVTCQEGMKMITRMSIDEDGIYKIKGKNETDHNTISLDINMKNVDKTKVIKKTDWNLRASSEKWTQFGEELVRRQSKFFQTFKLLSDPIVSDTAQPLNTMTISSEYGGTASTAQEKADLFAERLQNVHEEPNYRGFSHSTKTSVEKFIGENKAIFEVEPSRQYLEAEDGDEADLLKTVTVQEVKETLQICKSGSAQGPDQISYHVLKKLPDTFLLLIATLFSCCLHIGYFPDKWKCAKTILIPKPGKDPKQAKNHRPISLLSCLGKILERILAKRLSTHMEKNNLFAASQSGFRAGRMTSEHTLHMVENSFTAFKNKETVASIFLDAEMAFDKCWQNGIRYKLKKNLNLPNRYIRILSSFLSNRSLKVFQDGCWSAAVDIRAGTPQGSPLSPILYIIMVNDIPSSILSLGKLFQYADDIAMACRKFTFASVRDKLQKMINILEGWCIKWRIKLNGDKSHFLQIHRLRQQDNEDMSLQLFDDIVKPTTNAKFLGVDLDAKLRFVKHVDET